MIEEVPSEEAIKDQERFLRLTRPSQDRKIIDKLTLLSSGIENGGEDMRQLVQEIEEIKVDTYEVKRRAIGQLAKVDPKGTGVTIKMLEAFASDAHKIVGGEWALADLIPESLSSHHQADQMIARYIQSRSEEATLSPLQEFKIFIQRRNQAPVKAVAEKIVSLCQNPEVVWEELINEGIITRDYLENLDYVASWIEMADKWRMIEEQANNFHKGEIKALKAKVFAPYISRGIAASMIEEIVEGRFDMAEGFLNETLEMFAQIEEKTNFSAVSGLSFREKAARAVVVAASCSQMAGSTLMPPPLRPISLSDFRRLEYPEGFSSRPSVEITPSFEPTVEESRGETSAIPSSERGGSSAVENTPQELFKVLLKSVVWTLEGKDLGGYYRKNTAVEFVQDENKTWNWGIEWGKYPGNPKRVSYDSQAIKEIELNGNFSGFGHWYDLPAKYGYVVRPETIQVFVEGEPFDQNLYLDQDSAGNFFLRFEGRELPKGQITIKYGLVEARDYQLPPPDDEVLTEKFVDINKLPDAVKKQFQEIENSNLSLWGKAQRLRDWIKYGFTYSLDPAYSDYYQRARTPEEFITRIFEKKQTDCDVANTTLIALLRALDIPSRVVFGFNNGETFLNLDSNSLTLGENHAWVEAFVDGKWQVLDATPIKLDQNALEALKGGPEMGMGFPRSLEELLALLSAMPEYLMLTAQAFADVVRDNPELRIGILSAIYGSVVFRAYLRLKRLETKGRIAFEAVENAAWHIYGRGYNPYQYNIESTVWRILKEELYFPTLKQCSQMSKRFAEARERGRGYASLKKEDAQRIAYETDTDPLHFVTESMALDTRKVAHEVAIQNTGKIIERIVVGWERSVLPKLSSVEGRRDKRLHRIISEAILGKRWAERTSDGQLKIARNLQKSAEALEILGSKDPLDDYLKSLVEKAWSAYKKEANLRVRARKIPPNLRTKGQRERGLLPEPNLTKEEFERAMREEILPPLAVLWYVVNS